MVVAMILIFPWSALTLYLLCQYPYFIHENSVYTELGMVDVFRNYDTQSIHNIESLDVGSLKSIIVESISI